ncbi:hypothetical protein Pint_06568 [Pistacia integerrima]|uniref:Uncharacterized protein n=1 Tax=Pistacia integerrima TaxID=434235 RepID=A0ACC0Z3V5_9ROSI|nr:hypothetical protein Pint_06568 [Pistacia integerrima]
MQQEKVAETRTWSSRGLECLVALLDYHEQYGLIALHTAAMKGQKYVVLVLIIFGEYYGGLSYTPFGRGR